MSLLAEATAREAARERVEYAARYVVSDAELMRSISYVTKDVAGNVSESERDAITQIAGERIFRAYGSADRRAAERGTPGREYLRDVVKSVLASAGHEWRDVAQDYVKARKRQTDGSGPMLASADANPDAPWLAQAVARESERNGVPAPTRVSADRKELARELCGMVGADWRESEREQLLAALLCYLPESDGTEPPAAIEVAAEMGVSADAMRKRISRGAKLWRERVAPEPRDGVALVREAAGRVADRNPEPESVPVDGRLRPACPLSGHVGERAGMFCALRPINPAPVRADRPRLEPIDLAKVDAVNGAKRELARRTQVRAAGWSEATEHAARRNARAIHWRPVVGPARSELTAPMRTAAVAPRPDASGGALTAYLCRVGILPARSGSADSPALRVWRAKWSGRMERPQAFREWQVAKGYRA